MYEEDVAHYRQYMPRASEALADPCIRGNQTQIWAQTVDASLRAARLSRAQYTDGAISYRDVIDAERTAPQSL